MSAADVRSPGRPLRVHRPPLWTQFKLSARRFIQPLEPERKAALERQWESLDPRWRTPFQAFGRKNSGCAATIGLHPRCDFACAGCYLGEEANSIQPLSLDQIFLQLDQIRAWTGPKGNVQLTDGEVTLRPVEELLRVLERCRQLELMPMLMTHGDSFRRRPGLLERLCVEGGLTEVSIHIDTTMRGRLGYKHARHEQDLAPLRDEFAQLLREVRRKTGSTIRAATTMTVTRENLNGVAHVAAWCARNRDVFKMLSLLPVADVGRTERALSSVSPDECWAEVARALAPYCDDLQNGRPLHVGHPECNRVTSFLCFERRSSPQSPRFVKTVSDASDEDREFMERFAATGLMGIGYRGDAPLVGWARKLGAALRALPFLLGPGQRYLRRRLAAHDLRLTRTVFDLVRGELSVSGFSVVSHHFMGRAEIETPLGQERLSACVFKLPVGDEMKSMCEVNLLGARAQFYAQIPSKRSVRPVDSSR